MKSQTKKKLKIIHYLLIEWTQFWLNKNVNKKYK